MEKELEYILKMINSTYELNRKQRLLSLIYILNQKSEVINYNIKYNQGTFESGDIDNMLFKLKSKGLIEINRNKFLTGDDYLSYKITDDGIDKIDNQELDDINDKYLDYSLSSLINIFNRIAKN